MNKNTEHYLLAGIVLNLRFDGYAVLEEDYDYFAQHLETPEDLRKALSEWMKTHKKHRKY